MTLRCCMLAGSVDVAFFFLFHYLGSPIMAWVNVLSVPMYATAYWALKNRRNRLGVSLIWIEVLVHAGLGSLVIGWSSGFYYYLLMFIPALYAGSRSFRTATFAALCLWLYYVGLNIATHLIEPLQPIGDGALLGVYLFNLSVVFSMFAYLSMYYMLTVKRAYRSLRKMATTDSLTQLYNRRHMVELVNRDIPGNGTDNATLAFLLMDVDHFKQINDRHGHDCGDQVLSEISQLLKATLRDQDYVGRWGGEEFLAVLPNADSRQALQIAERVRQAVAEHDWNRQGLDTPVTLSIGVSQHQPGEMLGDCVARADAALYASKHGGRNRVEVAGQR